MSQDYLDGQRAAFTDILTYAKSLISTASTPEPWIDMSFYALVSIEEIDSRAGVTVDSVYGSATPAPLQV